MRVIKFRAVDRDGKVYPVKELHLIFDNGASVHLEGRPYEGDKFFTVVKFDKLMQYTGLKDKNGKEIYEGDIVCDTDGSGSSYKVLWHEGGARFVTEGVATGDIGLSISGFGDEMEVIGNIYENPELLSIPKHPSDKHVG